MLQENPSGGDQAPTVPAESTGKSQTTPGTCLPGTVEAGNGVCGVTSVAQESKLTSPGKKAARGSSKRPNSAAMTEAERLKKALSSLQVIERALKQRKDSFAGK